MLHALHIADCPWAVWLWLTALDVKVTEADMAPPVPATSHTARWGLRGHAHVAGWLGAARLSCMANMVVFDML